MMLHLVCLEVLGFNSRYRTHERLTEPCGTSHQHVRPNLPGLVFKDPWVCRFERMLQVDEICFQMCFSNCSTFTVVRPCSCRSGIYGRSSRYARSLVCAKSLPWINHVHTIHRRLIVNFPKERSASGINFQFLTRPLLHILLHSRVRSPFSVFQCLSAHCYRDSASDAFVPLPRPQLRIGFSYGLSLE